MGFNLAFKDLMCINIYALIFDEIYSTLYMSSALVAPWRWLPFTAKTYKGSKTNCAFCWEWTCMHWRAECKILTFCWPCNSVYLSQYLTNLMHKILFYNKFISFLVHQTATYRCDDTRDCVIQFWSPDDEHICSKHVEAWNKLIVKQNCVHQVG